MLERMLERAYARAGYARAGYARAGYARACVREYARAYARAKKEQIVGFF
jgi:hypothetical protein